MRQSVTQEFEYGCGIACYAFALHISYTQAAQQLGNKQAYSNRFFVKDIRRELNTAGIRYTSRHIKPTIRTRYYKDGTIVLVRRSKRYPADHYLIRHNNLWMDPWINLPTEKDITRAKSGYRKRLPGRAMYAIEPYV